MRRFYKTAEAGTAPGGHVVRLDGKALKTPLGHPLLLPSQALAVAIAAEWAAQGEVVKPPSMPLTRLANTLIDKSGGADRAAMNAELLKYGSSDLICYFATHPEALIKRQQAHWLPLLEWLKARYGIAFEPVPGIQYHPQPQASLDALKKAVEDMDAAEFTILQAAAMVVGSIAIALALLEERLTPEEAYEAACVDENYQLETWGEDEIARQRREAIRSELAEVVRFSQLLRASA
jgi:chaperone required for assembly of F1-ATPase